MPKIYKYQKVTDDYTTHALVEPDYATLESDSRITELCTVDGWTYVSIPNDVSLPVQSEVITSSLEEIIPDASLYTLIRKYSPHVRLILKRLNDGSLSRTEAILADRALGYIPLELATQEEVENTAETDMRSSILYNKTKAEIAAYIDANWTNLTNSKETFKKLCEIVYDVIKRQGLE